MSMQAHCPQHQRLARRTARLEANREKLSSAAAVSKLSHRCSHAQVIVRAQKKGPSSAMARTDEHFYTWAQH